MAPLKTPLSARQLNQYHVFLASPGDVSVERQHVRQFFERYNRHTAHLWNVRFEVVDWENYSTIGVGRRAQPPDLDDPEALTGLFSVMSELKARGLLLAAHDRSDGGLLATVCEMAFAGRSGMRIVLDELGEDPVTGLFSEELGMLLQVTAGNLSAVKKVVKKHGLEKLAHDIGQPTDDGRIVFEFGGAEYLADDRVNLHRTWSETTFRMQSLRDNPECALEEYDRLLDEQDPGLKVITTFDIEDDIAAPYLNLSAKPKVAILREQGVNSHAEIAVFFARAGFDAIDVHMSEVLFPPPRFGTGLNALRGIEL